MFEEILREELQATKLMVGFLFKKNPDGTYLSQEQIDTQWENWAKTVCPSGWV